eukprot:284679-Amphidinium_carterae.1
MRTVAGVGMIALLSGRGLDGLAASFIFVIAAGTAPMRAASAVTDLGLTVTPTSTYFDSEIAVRLIGSILLVSITTIVIAMCASMSWHQQQRKPQMCAASTQTDQDDATRVAGGDEIFVYPQGRRYHTASKGMQCSDECTVQSTTVHKVQDMWMGLRLAPRREPNEKK